MGAGKEIGRQCMACKDTHAFCFRVQHSFKRIIENTLQSLSCATCLPSYSIHGGRRHLGHYSSEAADKMPELILARFLVGLASPNLTPDAQGCLQHRAFNESDKTLGRIQAFYAPLFVTKVTATAEFPYPPTCIYLFKVGVPGAVLQIESGF